MSESLDPESVLVGGVSNLDPGYVYPPQVTGGLTDVGYDGGLADSVYTYSGSSTLQDVVPGSSSLALSTEDGYNEVSSVYDFIDGENPAVAQQLSGVSDPPFASAANSTPRPNATAGSNPFTFAIGALNKLGSSFATLFGNHGATISPAYVPEQGPQGAYTVPVTAVTGQTVLILVAVVVGVVLLLSFGKEVE
jgi:hypothetical protein